MSSSIDEKFSLYESCPSEESLREIIRALRGLIDSEKTASNLNKLGFCLLNLFSHSGNDADLDSNISVLQEALSLAYDDTAAKGKAFSNLGDAFQRRWEQRKSTEDLRSCVSSRRNAVNLTPVLDRSIADKLMDLSDTLSTKYEELSVEADLAEAIHVQRFAILLPQDGGLCPKQTDGAHVLASLLEDQFWKSMSWHALDEAFLWKAKLMGQRELQRQEDFHNHARGLSVCLLDRYKLHHLPGDLHNAITWAKEAVSHLSHSDEKLLEDSVPTCCLSSIRMGESRGAKHSRRRDALVRRVTEGPGARKHGEQSQTQPPGRCALSEGRYLQVGARYRVCRRSRHGS